MQTAPSTNDGKITRTAIMSNSSAQVGIISIGVSDFFEEEYEPGKKGITGGIWIGVRDQPELYTRQRFHAGSQIEVAGYRIQVDSISLGSDNLYYAFLTIYLP
jgi:hypothetical protein